MAKKDYVTVTEKAEAAFDAKLDSLDTQRERRDVLETATDLIPDQTAPNEGATINGVPQTELEKAEPVVVKPRAYGRKRNL